MVKSHMQNSLNGTTRTAKANFYVARVKNGAQTKFRVIVNRVVFIDAMVAVKVEVCVLIAERGDALSVVPIVSVAVKRFVVDALINALIVEMPYAVTVEKAALFVKRYVATHVSHHVAIVVIAYVKNAQMRAVNVAKMCAKNVKQLVTIAAKQSALIAVRTHVNIVVLKCVLLVRMNIDLLGKSIAPTFLEKKMSMTEKSLKFMKPKMTFGDTLRFTAYAYSKLLWMRDRGNTEVAGYGITTTEDPLLVTDFVLVKQECTGVSFDLDPNDIVDHQERMMDKGIPPWACMDILIHSHPGNSPQPSDTDEKNFVKAFSHPDWAIMFIIANGGATYCRMKINIGPGVVKEIKVVVDWTVPFCGTDRQAWEKEYKENVTKCEFAVIGTEGLTDPLWSNYPENELLLNEWEFDEIDCYWNSEGEVAYWNEDDGDWYLYEPITKEWYFGGGADSELFQKTDKPKESWANKVIIWAHSHANERELIREGA